MRPASFWFLSLVCVPALAQGPAVTFVDVTAQAGVKFVHNNGAAGKKLLPEALGPGVAFLDADGDGWLDLLFVNGRDWKAGRRRTTPVLYRNNHDGTFRDVTATSGLGVEVYGMGVAVGDYDGDGRDDVYITALEGDRLFHNDGGGRFRDVTRASGIDNRAFGTSAAWLDYDRDGRLDIFVANYVQWSIETDLWCSLDGAKKSYCTPESYKGTQSRLYRNVGAGRFVDVTAKAGLVDPSSKSLGVVVFDYNDDGWPDLFVANDTQPNKLWENTGKGVFAEVGVGAGVAFSEDGVARGAMGVDAGDYDRTGRQHLVVGNFANEMIGLYHNEGTGLFVDEAPRSAVGRESLLSLTFGVFFFDYDLDGYLDILAANGHLEEEIENVQPKVKYREPALLFHNQRGKGFVNVSAGVGRDFTKAIVGRGAAYGDYDRDGDLDVALTSNGGPALLLRNDGGNKNNWLSLRLRGERSNTNGYGARVSVTTGTGVQKAEVRSGSSYCSHSDAALTFGLGAERKVQAVDVVWPSGAKQRFTDLDGNRHLTIHETRGLSAQGPAPAAGSRQPSAAPQARPGAPALTGRR
jgi:hypothetical protein